MELMDDEDVLEAGIRIIAQPPGKKLQNMMQLSGGEKALTAISLLFAIQNLKPSPFCLLDEIEAALDDSNVDRFAQYLHKLTKNTQFIVITHRRGTMTAADRLYGITMQEKGISTTLCPSVFWKMNWTIRESAGKIERRSMSCNCMTRTSQQECLGILEWQGGGLERSKSMAEEKKGFSDDLSMVSQRQEIILCPVWTVFLTDLHILMRTFMKNWRKSSSWAISEFRQRMIFWTN